LLSFPDSGDVAWNVVTLGATVLLAHRSHPSTFQVVHSIAGTTDRVLLLFLRNDRLFAIFTDQSAHSLGILLGGDRHPVTSLSPTCWPILHSHGGKILGRCWSSVSFGVVVWGGIKHGVLV
jgi:hypothetical protein